MRLAAAPAIGLLAAVAAHGQAPPTGRVESCATSECHTSQVGHKFEHGPAAAGACEVCHVSTDQAAHRFALKRPGAELCSFCHLGQAAAGPGVHLPVAEGRCLDCHDPHGSQQAALLRGATTAAACGACHENVAHGGVVHKPLADGNCTACHRGHSSPHRALLVDSPRELCLSCHADVLDGLEAGAAAVGAAAAPTPVIHGPVAGGCLDCHLPHASDAPSLLAEPPQTLCTGCHDAVGRHAGEAAYPHGAVTDDRGCLNCHRPHAARTEYLLNAGPIDLCLGCHGTPVARADGTVVASLAGLAGPHRHVHEPVAEGRCRDCHDAHGGARPFLLTRQLTGEFYQVWQPEAYALCFGCHDAGAFTAERTELTGFRDGDRNLHYVHVVAPPRGGRSCEVCHEVHSGSSPRLIREKVPFGNWEIPIEFTATETGGSCAAGCHKARRYDRVHP